MKFKCLLFVVVSVLFALFLFSSCSDIGDVEDMGVGDHGGSGGGVGSQTVSNPSMTKSDTLINRNNIRNMSDTISVVE